MHNQGRPPSCPSGCPRKAARSGEDRVATDPVLRRFGAFATRRSHTGSSPASTATRQRVGGVTPRQVRRNIHVLSRPTRLLRQSDGPVKTTEPPMERSPPPLPIRRHNELPSSPQRPQGSNADSRRACLSFSADSRPGGPPKRTTGTLPAATSLLRGH